MPLIAISLISASALGYEILLMRLFSIAQWHHFAFLIISTALLGVGLSGTVLALCRRWAVRHHGMLWPGAAAAFGLSAVLAFALSQRLGLNPLELPWDAGQLWRFGATYLLLMTPFFFAASCIALAFMTSADRIGGIYRFDLAGAGFGAASMVGALFLLHPSDCLRLVVVFGFAAAAVSAFSRHSVIWLLAGVAVASLLPATWFVPRMSDYKALSQALRAPGAEIVARRSGPIGMVDGLRSPTVPIRHAPGLSLNSTGEIPEQLALFIDGGGMSAITRLGGDISGHRYLGDVTSAAAYQMLRRPDVLVIGAAGDEVPRAHHLGAGRITVAERDPNVADLLRDDDWAFGDGLFARSGIELHVADGRAFVAGTTLRFDLIQIPITGSTGPSSAGLGGLSESYLLTVEAFADHLDHLNPGGILSVTRWLNLPPRESVKLVATARAALEGAGVQDIEARLALLRGWNTTTLLVKKGRFTAAETARLRRFAADRAFDLAYYPGMTAGEANRFNILDAPYFHDAVLGVLSPAWRDYIDRYKFDIRPATDDRPFFADHFKWRTLPELLGRYRQGGVALVEWGYVVLIATLLQAITVGTLLILLPLRWLPRNAAAGLRKARVGVYFLAIGLAFLFIEIAFIQRLVLFLGHPLYAVAVVLAGFLVFAGLGAGATSGFAAWCRRRRIGRPVALVVGGIAVMALAYIAVLPGLTSWLVALPAPAKVAVSLVLVAPLAGLMGMPFPLALSDVAATAPHLVPWAWGINGFASVISAVLATVLAVGFGFRVVIVLAVTLYALAALTWRPAPPE